VEQKRSRLRVVQEAVPHRTVGFDRQDTITNLALASGTRWMSKTIS